MKFVYETLILTIFILTKKCQRFITFKNNNLHSILTIPQQDKMLIDDLNIESS